jgi:coiled-coil-helix-coiled-coil-helix domain-containing protein 2
MGRRSSGGFRRASPGPTRSARTVAAPPPQRTQAPAPTQQGPGMMSGLGGTLMQGMAFGAGSEVAHQAVRGLMGSGSSGHSEAYSQPQGANEPCFQENQNFMNCLQFNKNDINMCQSYLDLFKQCKGQF